MVQVFLEYQAYRRLYRALDRIPLLLSCMKEEVLQVNQDQAYLGDYLMLFALNYSAESMDIEMVHLVVPVECELVVAGALWVESFDLDCILQLVAHQNHHLLDFSYHPTCLIPYQAVQMQSN